MKEEKNIEIDRTLSEELERLTYQNTMAKENILHMISNDFDLTTEAFKRYEQIYLDGYIRRAILLDKLHGRYFDPAWKDQVIEWRVSFEDCTLRVEIDTEKAVRKEVYPVEDKKALAALRRYFLTKSSCKEVIAELLNMNADMDTDAFKHYEALQQEFFELENRAKLAIYNATVPAEQQGKYCRYSFDFEAGQIVCVLK